MQHLKQKLIKIRENNYKPYKGLDLDSLIADMTANIGSPDPVLRDELIYLTFCYFAENETISKEALLKLLHICVDDNHLFYNIGEIGTDSVFTRSFSALIIPVVFESCAKTDALLKNEVQMVKTKVMNYVVLEKDLRAYVQGKGWAHARCHIADCIEALAGSKHMNERDLLDLLEGIKILVQSGGWPFIFEDDERLAAAFMSILNRCAAGHGEVAQWIESFEDSGLSGGMIHDLNKRTNEKFFFQSLYFKLFNKNYGIEVLKTVEKVLFNNFDLG